MINQLNLNQIIKYLFVFFHCCKKTAMFETNHSMLTLWDGCKLIDIKCTCTHSFKIEKKDGKIQFVKSD